MRGEPSAMRWSTRLRTPFARPAATATVRARTVMRTRASTGPVIGRSRWKCSGLARDYGETLIQVPSRACTRSPALTRRSTIRAAASEDTCSESSISLIVSTGTPLWTISSMTERTTSARRAWSRRSGQIRRSFHGQARFSVRAGTTTGTRGPAWPAMICSSRTGTLSANRYTVSFTEVLSAKFYRSTAPPL